MHYVQSIAVQFIPKVEKCTVQFSHHHDDHDPSICRDVTVVVLDRPRHSDLIKQIRDAGARIRLISDGDIGGAIEVASHQVEVVEK